MAIAYDRATFRTGQAAPGTVALWGIIQGQFQGATSLGIYNARFIRGSSDSLSLHAEGRAVDVVPPTGRADELAEWAVRNAERYQVQEVIQYTRKRIWTSAKAAQGWRRYSGPSSYHHIHIGQNRRGAGVTEDGRTMDPLVMAESYVESLEAYGLRWWQLLGLLAGTATIVGVEMGTFDRILGENHARR